MIITDKDLVDIDWLSEGDSALVRECIEANISLDSLRLKGFILISGKAETDTIKGDDVVTLTAAGWKLANRGG